MEDVKRQDLRLLVRELTSFGRLATVGIFAAMLWFLPFREMVSWYTLLAGYAVLGVVWFTTAWSDSRRKRFLNRRFEALWSGCQDRLSRFDEVLKRMRKDQIADLTEMPTTIRRVHVSLYLALRRADMIAFEVESSEAGLYNAPPIWTASPNDAQSKELYQLADRNIAEYRQQLAGVMAGVKRAEAQSAVFMTTLDTLRMKMLGYRLVGKSPEIPSHEFLEAVNEAKMQLRAIDTALEELELTPYPRMIAAMGPPPIPDEIRARIELNE